MIHSEFDEDDGHYYLSRSWDEKRDKSITPQQAAAEYQARIAEVGARQAYVCNENPAVAAALMELPGFQFEREGSVELWRPWPSGVERCDMTGVRVVTAAEARRVYDFLTKEVELLSGDMEDLLPIFEAGGFNVFLTEAGREVAFGSIVSGNGVGWIGYVAVLPSECRRGLGTRIMEILLCEMDKTPLERYKLGTGVDNAAAMRLYDRFGFLRATPPQVWVKYLRPE